jgi:hypothetical protein
MALYRYARENLALVNIYIKDPAVTQVTNGRAHIRHQCRKTIVLNYHRCLINTGVEKMNNI